MTGLTTSYFSRATSFFNCSGASRDLHSFPTRRSSDLPQGRRARLPVSGAIDPHRADLHGEDRLDRKSTRLNSSHQIISYAVFCLKKKINPQMVKRVDLDPPSLQRRRLAREGVDLPPGR